MKKPTTELGKVIAEAREKAQKKSPGKQHLIE